MVWKGHDTVHVYLKLMEWGIGSTREMFLPHTTDHSREAAWPQCEHQALAQSSAPHVMVEPWTLLPHCLRHSRHHIPPTPISASDYSRCQHRPLIRSVHNKIAVCLSSSLTFFCQLLIHSPRNGNSQFLFVPPCLPQPTTRS